MYERYQNGETDFRLPEFIEHFQPLPYWIADRLLGPEGKSPGCAGRRSIPRGSVTSPTPQRFLSSWFWE